MTTFLDKIYYSKVLLEVRTKITSDPWYMMCWTLDKFSFLFLWCLEIEALMLFKFQFIFKKRFHLKKQYVFWVIPGRDVVPKLVSCLLLVSVKSLLSSKVSVLSFWTKIKKIKYIKNMISIKFKLKNWDSNRFISVTLPKR